MTVTSHDAEVEEPEKKGPRRSNKRITSKHDWAAIKAMYVEGHEVDGDIKLPSIQEVSTHFKINPAQVRRRSAAEHWVQQREAFQVQLASKRARLKQQDLAKQSVQFDTDTFGTAKIGIAMVQRRLAEIAGDWGEHQRHKNAVKEAIRLGNPVPATSQMNYAAVDSRELEVLGRAAQSFHSLGKGALGEQVTRHEVSGPGGMPIQHEHSVSHILRQDDPERLKQFVQVMQRSGLQHLLDEAQDPVDNHVPLLEEAQHQEDDQQQIYEGEVVDEPEESRQRIY